MGPIQNESYTGIMMAPMKSNDDAWIASVASFIRSNFENGSSPVSVEEVTRIRKATSTRTKMYSFDSLWASVPRPLELSSGLKATASHTGAIRKGSTATPIGAFTFEGWTTDTSQQAGMWYMVEIPEAKKLTEFQFKSQAIRRGFRQGAPPPIQTCPSEFDVEVSLDGKQWTKILTQAKGTGGFTSIRFEPVSAKFLRLTLTKSEPIIHGERLGKPFDFEVTWTMREMKIFAL
jgi:hypothetical protein